MVIRLRNRRSSGIEKLLLILNTALKDLEISLKQDFYLNLKPNLEALPDISALTSMMPDLDISIRRRWLEAQKCQQAGCYLAAVILMGSILEALLLSRASMEPIATYQAKCAPKDKNGSLKKIEQWELNYLIQLAVELLWLKPDRGKFSHALRESRNVVHPYVEIKNSFNCDEATCKTSWEVLKGSIDDLILSIKTKDT